MEVHGRNEIDDDAREDRVMLWVIVGSAAAIGLIYLLASVM